MLATRLLLLSSRNFGSASYWGLDLSAQVIASDRVTLTAGYSFQSRECFDFDEDGDCPGPDDLSLNALNNLHREFVGAPELGRLALVRVKYEM